MYTTSKLKQLIEKETGKRLHNQTLFGLVNRGVITRPVSFNGTNMYNNCQASKLIEYFNAISLTMFASILKSEDIEITYRTLKTMTDNGELPVMVNVSPCRIPVHKLQEAIAIVRKKYTHVPREYALEYINELRGHMTQAEMANELCVSESLISRIVNEVDYKVTGDFYERLSRLVEEKETMPEIEAKYVIVYRKRIPEYGRVTEILYYKRDDGGEQVIPDIAKCDFKGATLMSEKEADKKYQKLLDADVNCYIQQLLCWRDNGS